MPWLRATHVSKAFRNKLTSFDGTLAARSGICLSKARLSKVLMVMPRCTGGSRWNDAACRILLLMALLRSDRCRRCGRCTQLTDRFVREAAQYCMRSYSRQYGMCIRLTSEVMDERSASLVACNASLLHRCARPSSDRRTGLHSGNNRLIPPGARDDSRSCCGAGHYDAACSTLDLQTHAAASVAPAYA